MTRPIGKRVIQAVEIIERIGPATYLEAWKHMEGVTAASNASKFLARAVDYGLAEKSGAPAKYRAVPGWRAYLNGKPASPIFERRRAASVWELGSLA